MKLEMEIVKVVLSRAPKSCENRASSTAEGFRRHGLTAVLNLTGQAFEPRHRCNVSLCLNSLSFILKIPLRRYRHLKSFSLV